MRVCAGARLGPYEILALIGAGGMGEVYKARDSRLNRIVAIKVLPAERMTDTGRKQRFIHEAQAASALNHPNIVTLHDIAADCGCDYLVMEYVAGKTLDALIPRAGMRLGELLRVAIQAADGLSSAHEAGIIHRDLKPSNIMVSESGLVKILDFGLAKLAEHAQASEDAATRTLEAETDPGTVMGTAAYMSPEQAEGKSLDARSDIFSFGAVLYEMAAGRRAFSGDSPAAIMAAVINKEPTPLSEAAPGLPTELERVILRCLRKDPGKRQQHMTDVKVLLEELKEESDSGKLTAGEPNRGRNRKLWAAAAAILVLGIAAAGVWLTHDHKQPAPRIVPLTTFAGSETQPSFSPDGNQVVFSWNGEKQDNWDLYVKMIGNAAALRLTTDPADDQFPAWSSDGRQIAFLKSGQHAGLYVISPLGGTEQKIADFDAAPGAPAWSPDGKFLLVARNRGDERPLPGAGALFVVPVEGGEPRLFLAATPGQWYKFPSFSPDGRSVTFDACRGSLQAPACDLHVAAVSADLRIRGAPRQLTAPAGYRAGVVWGLDGRSLVYSSSTSTIIENFLFSIAPGDEAPRRLEIASQGAVYPAVARVGNRLAFARWLQDSDVWRFQAGSKPEPLLVSSAVDMSAQFSPDGRRIVFASSRGGERIALWLAERDGSRVVPLTKDIAEHQGSPNWSPDGRWIAFDERDNAGTWSIKVVEATGGQARQLTSGPFSSALPTWSRDGKWIYCTSGRTGRSEIWRIPSQGGPAEQATHDGGFMAMESPDASTLYYTKTGGAGPLFSRPLRGGEERQVLERVVLRGFAVFRDGIYYLWSDPATPTKNAIRFHDFATGRSRLIEAIPARLWVYLSVSADRKTFLFTQFVSAGSDLMLIENFH